MVSIEAPSEHVAPAHATQIQSSVCAFVRTARENAYTVGIAEELDAQRLLSLFPVTDRSQFYWGMRSLLCTNRQQWENFDALFEGFWRTSNLEAKINSSSSSSMASQQNSQQTNSKDGGNVAEVDSAGEGTANNDTGGGSREGASAYERLAGVDFQFIANTELQRQVERLVERLAKRMRQHATRRKQTKKTGHLLNLRKTLRQSLQYGGVAFRLAFQQRQPRQPRLVLIVDVSRSMSIYSTIFLRFSRGLVTIFRDADAFACHTRLVHITDALRNPDLVKVKHHLALISNGWSGGTRLGECLESFNREYGRSVNRRSLVIIVSDGLDTGEPEKLVKELTHLRERSRRVIWLNPLLGRSGYETKTQSMLAALPNLDLFAPAHNLKSLEALEPELINL